MSVDISLSHANGAQSKPLEQSSLMSRKRRTSDGNMSSDDLGTYNGISSMRAESSEGDQRSNKDVNLSLPNFESSNLSIISPVEAASWYGLSSKRLRYVFRS